MAGGGGEGVETGATASKGLSVAGGMNLRPVLASRSLVASLSRRAPMSHLAGPTTVRSQFRTRSTQTPPHRSACTRMAVQGTAKREPLRVGAGESWCQSWPSRRVARVSSHSKCRVALSRESL